jgi:hypothetical protein
MYSVAIMNNGYPEWFFLLELRTQCGLAKYAYSRLVEYSRTEIAKPQKDIYFQPEQAAQVVADCTVFLSAVAMIANLLFAPAARDPDSKVRAAKLRQKLGEPSLPIIGSKSVRNDFEHVDERLDGVIRSHPDQYICQLHISRDAPSFPVVLRRFDPLTLSICFFERALDIKACIEEIEQLDRLLDEAMKTPLDRKRQEAPSPDFL